MSREIIKILSNLESEAKIFELRNSRLIEISQGKRFNERKFYVQRLSARLYSPLQKLLVSSTCF